MDAKAFAGAASQELAVDRTCAPTVHALFLFGPEVDALGPGIPLDHQLRIIVGMVGQGLDCDVVAGIDFDSWFQKLAEIAPVNRVGCRRQIVVVWPALPRRDGLGARWRNKRCATTQSGCTGGAKEGSLQETAPLSIEVVEELLAMELEFRAIVIVTRTHEKSLPQLGPTLLRSKSLAQDLVCTGGAAGRHRAVAARISCRAAVARLVRREVRR